MSKSLKRKYNSSLETVLSERKLVLKVEGGWARTWNGRMYRSHGMSGQSDKILPILVTELCVSNRVRNIVC